MTKTEAAYAKATIMARSYEGVWRKDLTKTVMRLSHWGRHMWRHLDPGEALIMTKSKNRQVHYQIVNEN